MILIGIASLLFCSTPCHAEASALQAPKERAVMRSASKNGEGLKSCTEASLSEKRSGDYKKAFDARKYAEAADGLQSYLDQDNGRCYTDMVFQKGAKKKAEKPLDAYLWALNDVAFARLKAGQYDKCIEITKGLQDEYFDGALSYAKNKKLKLAIANNEKACEEKRTGGLSEEKSVLACPFKITDRTISISGLGEDPAVYRNVSITAVKFSAKINEDVCLALIESSVNAELLDGDESDAPVMIPFLIEAKRNSSPVVLSAMNSAKSTSGFNCGEFRVTPLKNEKGSHLFRLSGDFGFCHGGTASGSYDSLWASSPSISKVDEINIVKH